MSDGKKKACLLMLVPVMALRRRMESMLKAHPHAGCMSCPFIFNASCVLADAAAHSKPQVDST